MKNKFTVKLNNIIDIKTFIEEVSKFETNIEAIRGRYEINAKSLMGMFSLDLSKPVDIIIYSKNEEEISRFKEIIKKYEVL